MKKLTLAIFSFAITITCFASTTSIESFYKPKQNYYQIIVYHVLNNTQMQQVDNYLQNSYIPALHKAGVSKVGVFKPLANDTAVDKKIYVFMPLKSLAHVAQIDQSIWNDPKHTEDGVDYLNAAFNKSSFVRKEAIILKAFEKMTEFSVPNLTGTAAEKIYELRSYEGATEKLYRKKVDMFNAGGEVALFSRLEFNAVFYGEVLAGSRMPNLMYMTSFNSIADREAHWNKFKEDAEWKKLSGMEEYKNTVSRNETILMHATSYSEL